VGNEQENTSKKIEGGVYIKTYI